MPLLGRLLLFGLRRLWRRLPLRWRRSGPLLLPVVELLFLLLLLLRSPLLYRRRGPGQRMCLHGRRFYFLALRRAEVWRRPVLGLRRQVTILRWLLIPVRRRWIPIFRRRSPLLFHGARRRLHLLYLVVSALRLSERTEAGLRLLRRLWPRGLVGLIRPGRRLRAYEGLLVQVSTGLRLSLIKRARWR
jgi:hypothetical protein